MRIQHDFEYDAPWHEISAEFCEHDSKYQAKVIDGIGSQFWVWATDKTRPATYRQILEMAEQLNDAGRWFIKTLCDCMEDKE